MPINASEIPELTLAHEATAMSGSIGMSRVSSRRSSIATLFYSEHKYRLMKTLGIGAFSKVKLAVHIPTGQKVAIKIMNRHKMRDMEEKGTRK